MRSALRRAFRAGLLCVVAMLAACGQSDPSSQEQEADVAESRAPLTENTQYFDFNGVRLPISGSGLFATVQLPAGGLPLPPLQLVATKDKPAATLALWPLKVRVNVPLTLSGTGAAATLRFRQNDGTWITCRYEGSSAACDRSVLPGSFVIANSIELRLDQAALSAANMVLTTLSDAILIEQPSILLQVFISVINFLFPPTTITPPGSLAPTDPNRQAELASTALALSEIPAACGAQTEPQVFVTYNPRTVLRGPASCIQSGTCAVTTLNMPAAPTGCQYEVLYADSLMGRLPGGRVMQASIVGQCCLGTPPAFTCPNPSIPVTNLSGGCSAGRFLTTRALAVHISNDCGATWTDSAIPANGIADTSGTGLNLPFLDRPELYVDPFSDRVFVSFRLAQTVIPPCDGFNNNTQVVMVASKGSNTTTALNFSTYSTLGGAPPVTVMGSLPAGSTSRFAKFYCNGTSPILDFERTAGSGAQFTTSDFSAALAGSQFLCAASPNGQPGGLVNVIASASIAPTTENTPSYRVVYSGMNGGRQVLHVVRLFLLTTPSFRVTIFPPSVTVVQNITPILSLEQTIDVSAAGQEAIWGHLIAPDTLGGATVNDRTTILRWAEVDTATATVRERFQSFFPSTGAGLQGDLATWTIAPAAFGATACNTTTPCFAGDYHYGAFIDKQSNGAMRFLATWAAPDATTGRLSAAGSVVTTAR
jgi:hypothetical protein